MCSLTSRVASPRNTTPRNFLWAIDRDKVCCGIIHAVFLPGAADQMSPSSFSLQVVWLTHQCPAGVPRTEGVPCSGRPAIFCGRSVYWVSPCRSPITTLDMTNGSSERQGVDRRRHIYQRPCEVWPGVTAPFSMARPTPVAAICPTKQASLPLKRRVGKKKIKIFQREVAQWLDA